VSCKKQEGLVAVMLFWSIEYRGAIMTTTLIYEPIASISDDYFRRPEASGSESRRDNTGDHGLGQTRRLAPNITDGNAFQPDCNSPGANRSTLSGDTA
jgi:hypothetical protein